MNIYDQKLITGRFYWDILPLSPVDSVTYDGLCSIPMEAEIFIDNGISGERAIDVVLHECLHAMEHMYDMDLPEDTIGKLGNMLSRLFVENEWLTTYINEQIQIHKIGTANEGAVIPSVE
jgi:hypothetical protein